MALRSDIKPVADNDPVDLQERRAGNADVEMSKAVLDLRNPGSGKAANKDNNFFFEFLPTAAMNMPTANLDDVKTAASKQLQKALAFVRRHPRYFVAAALILAAVVLFTLSAMTRRTVIRNSPETPAAVTAPTETTEGAAAEQSASSAEQPPASNPAPTANRSTPAGTDSGARTAPTTSQPAPGTSSDGSDTQQPEEGIDPAVCVPPLVIVDGVCKNVVIQTP